ncbi:hypothetical protein ATCC90586_007491 [Pythium insidiosum]|nr:hypothetical protein ATCC90586_007491 [Pythium insidiosum]
MLAIVAIADDDAIVVVLVVPIALIVIAALVVTVGTLVAELTMVAAVVTAAPAAVLAVLMARAAPQIDWERRSIDGFKTVEDEMLAHLDSTSAWWMSVSTIDTAVQVSKAMEVSDGPPCRSTARSALLDEEQLAALPQFGRVHESTSSIASPQGRRNKRREEDTTTSQSSFEAGPPAVQDAGSKSGSTSQDVGIKSESQACNTDSNGVCHEDLKVVLVSGEDHAIKTISVENPPSRAEELLQLPVQSWESVLKDLKNKESLKNAPATFNRMVSHALRPFRSIAPSYFDDIFIHSKAEGNKSDVEVHLEHLEKVFRVMRENKLYANLKKCIFFAPEIPVLGRYVSKDGVRADPEKYARNYAELVRPLSTLIKKDVEWVWTQEHQTAFDAVKKSLQEAPVLALPDYSRPFHVVCDASDFAIGCALMQHTLRVLSVSSATTLGS